MAITSPADTATQHLAVPTRQLLIGGEWRDATTGSTFETHDPGTGRLLARVAEGGAHDIDLAVAAARQALNGPW
jgi:acyl-CoA reductase-like NAD-dependent aldehyde dehydrogenase